MLRFNTFQQKRLSMVLTHEASRLASPCTSTMQTSCHEVPSTTTRGRGRALRTRNNRNRLIGPNNVTKGRNDRACFHVRHRPQIVLFGCLNCTITSCKKHSAKMHVHHKSLGDSQVAGSPWMTNRTDGRYRDFLRLDPHHAITMTGSSRSVLEND